MEIRVEPSRGLVSATIGAITRLMRERDLMPGDRLPSEIALARELQVSRTVVREAFRALAGMGIIELATGRRANVAPLDHRALSLILEHGVRTEQITIQQIYDVRRTIEMRIAALAALRRSEEEAEALREEAAGMRANLDIPDLVMRHDLELHKILARASRNPVFALLLGAFEGIIAQTWPIGWRARTTPEAREAMIANHEKIAEAVVQGEPERAMQAMAAHFDETVRALISAGLV